MLRTVPAIFRIGNDFGVKIFKKIAESDAKKDSNLILQLVSLPDPVRDVPVYEQKYRPLNSVVFLSDKEKTFWYEETEKNGKKKLRVLHGRVLLKDLSKELSSAIVSDMKEMHFTGEDSRMVLAVYERIAKIIRDYKDKTLLEDKEVKPPLKTLSQKDFSLNLNRALKNSTDRQLQGLGIVISPDAIEKQEILSREQNEKLAQQYVQHQFPGKTISAYESGEKDQTEFIHYSVDDIRKYTKAISAPHYLMTWAETLFHTYVDEPNARLEYKQFLIDANEILARGGSNAIMLVGEYIRQYVPCQEKLDACLNALAAQYNLFIAVQREQKSPLSVSLPVSFARNDILSPPSGLSPSHSPSSEGTLSPVSSIDMSSPSNNSSDTLPSSLISSTNNPSPVNLPIAISHVEASPISQNMNASPTSVTAMMIERMRIEEKKAALSTQPVADVKVQEVSSSDTKLPSIERPRREFFPAAGGEPRQHASARSRPSVTPAKKSSVGVSARLYPVVQPTRAKSPAPSTSNKKKGSLSAPSQPSRRSSFNR